MKQRKIMLKTIEDAKKFVNASIKCDFDIDVFYNRVVIDAKSILGVSTWARMQSMRRFLTRWKRTM